MGKPQTCNFCECQPPRELQMPHKRNSWSRNSWWNHELETFVQKSSNSCRRNSWGYYEPASPLNGKFPWHNNHMNHLKDQSLAGKTTWITFRQLSQSEVLIHTEEIHGETMNLWLLRMPTSSETRNATQEKFMVKKFMVKPWTWNFCIEKF